MNYKTFIREVPDFPKPGILFYDITTLLKDSKGYGRIIHDLTERYRHERISKIVGIESRGFILGCPLAYNLGVGFVPIRKPGKLPAETFEVEYDLEYGSNSLAIHQDAVSKGERVLVVDDLLATGGTAAAAVHLLRQAGADIVGCAFAIELLFLSGRQKIEGCEIHSLMTYS